MANCKCILGSAFKVEQWDRKGLHIEETLAVCGNVLVARAAFQAAIKARPGENITLRQGIRVIESREPV
ncbi:hypothetical protein H2509_18485 [Stappia sp. F7233]|uniref:Uncharacterized protein n=1 Tax=Stappia albiluteola TaxID=2758565 RepID=A0A839AGY2_9HYPH|nr:hypothetical protein [Stappia albiluteola]MBA5779120.1 hypothetical protein [Stappia albiluteola]